MRNNSRNEIRSIVRYIWYRKNVVFWKTLSTSDYLDFHKISKLFVIVIGNAPLKEFSDFWHIYNIVLGLACQEHWLFLQKQLKKEMLALLFSFAIQIKSKRIIEFNSGWNFSKVDITSRKWQENIASLYWNIIEELRSFQQILKLHNNFPWF